MSGAATRRDVPPAFPPGLAERLPGVVFEVDRKARCVWVNAPWTELTGHAAGEALGYGWLGVLAHEDRERASRLWTAVVGAGTDFDADLRILRADGGVRWVHAVASPIRDASGRVTRYAGFLVDVTARREQEAARVRAQEEYRDALASLEQVIFRTDAEGRWTFLNAAWTRLTGVAIERALGRSHLEQVVEEDQPGMRDAFRLMAVGHSDGSRLQLRYHRTSAAGAESTRWIEVHARAVRGADGRFQGTAGTLVDVTERRTLEAQLQQAQKLEAVGQLAGGIAHDFNNLMTAVRGFSGLLLTDPSLGEHHREEVMQIDRAAARAAALTRQLLAFSRRQLLQPREASLNALVEEVDRMLARLLPSHILRHLALAPDAGFVMIDVAQLEQVLLNLALNARDAMPMGGELQIATGRRTLGGHPFRRQYTLPPGEYAWLTVRDTGVGMSEATMRRIFEPFFTTKPRGQGTGLGLATVDGIVHQMGGHVEVESTPGEGTTFTVYLPLVAAPNETAVSGEASPLPMGEPVAATAVTILVVDDEEPVRSVVSRTLEKAGYRVISAADGDEALRWLAEIPPSQRSTAAGGSASWPHLVLTDVVMPRVGGRALGDAVAARYPGLHVLYMSGYTADELFRQGLLDASRPLLCKPFSRNELLEAVRRHLERDRSAAA